MPGAVAAAAAGRRQRGRGRAVPGHRAVRRPRGRGPAGVRARTGGAGAGQPDLPGAGRHAAGHRAGRRPAARPDRRPGRRPPGRPVPAAVGRQPGRAAAPPDAARDRGLELGPAGRRRADGPAPAVGVQRRGHPGQRRAASARWPAPARRTLPGRPGSTPARSSRSWPRWSTSPWSPRPASSRCGTGCWRPCGPTPPTGWPRRARRTGPGTRTPRTSSGWPSGPSPCCAPASR